MKNASTIRTDHLHEVQTRMESEKNDLLEMIDGDFTAKKNNAKRELKSLDKKCANSKYTTNY